MTAQGFDDGQTRSFTPLTAGTRVAHYEIISKIGAGGMGEVYLAEDSQLDRKVALKFLSFHLSQDETSRARFTREAKAAAKLDHPNIVPVYEVGEYQGRPFFAMAHIEGQSLREVVKQGKLTVSGAIDYCMQICEGLHKAHESGVVHRDIKPGNIIIDREQRPRILDFGLATLSGEEKLTKTGSTLGTVGYMSPEQITGKDVDHRSDIFSIGVILYEMLTGRRPFEGDNDAAVARSITDETPEPVSRFKSGVSGELQQIVDKALFKDPTLRYQHADGMIADLKRIDSERVSARSGNRLAAIAASVLIIVIAGYYVYSNFIAEPQTKSDEPKRLVVLPFDNSGPEDQQYFVDGMTDEVITKLSSIENLKVIASQSAAKMKREGMDISAIGKELGVEYVLDASVHWQESSSGSKRVKLVIQLIEVSDESILWGKSYDTIMSEVFTVQSNMAQQVAEQLGVVLSSSDKLKVWERYTHSEEAWDYYLRGGTYHNRGYYGTKKDMLLAIEMYKKAIEIDSLFGRAYRQMSEVYSRMYVLAWDTSDSCKLISRTMAERAIELSSLQQGRTLGHRALGLYYARFEEDWDKALEEWEIAYGGKEKAYDDASFLWLAHMVMRYQGRWEEVYENMKKVVEAEPKQENAWRDLARVCHRMRKYEEAEQYCKQSISLEPDWLNPSWILFDIYLDWQCDIGKAREVLSDLRGKMDSTNYGLQFLMFRLVVLEGNVDSIKMRLGKVTFDDYWLAGGLDNAGMFLDSSVFKVREMLKSGPGYLGYYLRVQGLNFARLGIGDSAMYYIQQAMDFKPYSKDKCFGTDPLIDRFKIFVYLGELDSALAQAEMLLSVPALFDLGPLLLNPDYKELIRLPEFALLVREYGNQYHKRVFEEKVGPL